MNDWKYKEHKNRNTMKHESVHRTVFKPNVVLLDIDSLEFLAM